MCVYLPTPILVISMPVIVTFTWSPAKAKLTASSLMVRPREKRKDLLAK